MLDQFRHKMQHRAAALLLSIDGRLDRILKGWLLLAGLACAARIALSPQVVNAAGLSTYVPYMLLVVAPFASTLLALHWFADGERHPQPSFRLARVGRWRLVDRSEAQRHRLYGTSGIMVSLLLGMMLNVPVRAAEYLTAMPPISQAVPPWLSTLHLAMTFDVVLFSSLYMIAFVAALRRVPSFPRLLVAIWIGDVAMQLFTAQLVAGTGGLPEGVASSLHNLLDGNIKKTLISVALWLPYLLLSQRVNVTFRHRVLA